MSSSASPDDDSFYDYSTKSVSSLYDEEGASSYYLTVEAAAIRLTLGLPAAYSVNNNIKDDVEQSHAGSSMGEYTDVVASDSSEETEESSVADTPKQTTTTQSTSSIQQEDILSKVPSSIRELKRSSASASSASRVGYDEIYSGGSRTFQFYHSFIFSHSDMHNSAS
jgi:hypothetical protein